MRYRFNLLFLTILTASCQLNGQNQISVNIPTAEEESEYIWRTIQDIDFFEKNNYQIALPEGSFIEKLKTKAKSGNLFESDHEALRIFVRDSVYNRADYNRGYQKIVNELQLINSLIREIEKLDLNWNFKQFDMYEVNLTLYGPGGSYNPDEGSILIFTTTDGKFKNYANPTNTIIHEIVHIGIEEAIVNKHQVPHTLKERIVDTFVSLNFKQRLPDYRVQDMGEYRIDSYLKTKGDLKELDKFVQRIQQDN